MKHIFTLILISVFFIDTSPAQALYESSEEIKKATQEKQEKFRQMVLSRDQPPQQMIEKGLTIRSSTQKTLVDEAMAWDYGQQYLYVERWMPKQAWLNLSKEERQEYFSSLGEVFQKLKHEGILVLGFAINSHETRYGSDAQYVSVWQMPSESAVNMLEESVAQAGWYDYFELINTHGDIMPPAAVQEDIVGLK